MSTSRNATDVEAAEAGASMFVKHRKTLRALAEHDRGSRMTTNEELRSYLRGAEKDLQHGSHVALRWALARVRAALQLLDEVEASAEAGKDVDANLRVE